MVTAFSGATGAPIHTWRTPGHLSFGINVMSGFDADQDGVNDLIAGADQEGVCLMSGRDGTFLKQFWPPLDRGVGWGQVMLAPPPGERYPLFVYSEREWFDFATNPPVGNSLPGLLWAYRCNPVGVRAYGVPDASPGYSPPRSGMRDMPGQAVRWTLSDAAPNQLALLLLGVSNTLHGPMALPAPLDPFGMPGITLRSSANIVLPMFTGTTGTASGYAQADLMLPPSQSLSLVGTTLFSQWLWIDPFDPSHCGSTAGQRFIVQ